MADVRIPSPPAPGSWGEAFAALPAETPPGDGWQRVAGQLDARRRRHAPAWLGIAAAAGLVLAVGVWTARPGPEPASPAADQAVVVATQPAPEAANSSATDAAPPPTPDRLPARETTPRIATTPEPATGAGAAGAGATGAGATAGPVADTALAGLQRESAHLEALLALARDDSVGSAGAVLLADAFDARLAGIDALLANPGLADDEREALWQARVDTLRQATGFTSTQRLLAAQGHGDAWLASVD